MALPVHRVRFVRSERVCPTTATFTFERPPGYSFRAGEFFSLTLDTRDGEVRHFFSHADAPQDGETMLLTRLTGSPFKDALLALRPGDEARFSGPSGRLVIGPGVGRAAFLVGGVGISPVRSIVRDCALSGSEVELLVFNGTADESCIPFREELDGYEHDTGRLRAVHVLDGPSASASWAGERGRITADLVRRHCDPLDGWEWYVCGPPMMVEAMREVASELGIPADRLTFELFAGYR